MKTNRGQQAGIGTFTIISMYLAISEYIFLVRIQTNLHSNSDGITIDCSWSRFKVTP